MCDARGLNRGHLHRECPRYREGCDGLEALVRVRMVLTRYTMSKRDRTELTPPSVGLDPLILLVCGGWIDRHHALGILISIRIRE